MNPLQLSLALWLAFGAVPALSQSPSALCGGIGQADQQKMKQAAGSHDLMLTFATTTGSYLADIEVQVRNSSGAVVLESRCDGPIMLADLPGAGKYRITAKSAGVARDKTVTVAKGKRPVRATLVWPAETR
jgi:hypothetical protein